MSTKMKTTDQSLREKELLLKLHEVLKGFEGPRLTLNGLDYGGTLDELVALIHQENQEYGKRLVEKIQDDIMERHNQHAENLELWNNGTLTPTEPDKAEREKVVYGLSVAMYELQKVLDQITGDTEKVEGK